MISTYCVLNREPSYPSMLSGFAPLYYRGVEYLCRYIGGSPGS